MKKKMILAFMALMMGSVFASNQHMPLQTKCNSAMDRTLYAYATYQALLEAMEDVPQGSVVVVKYAKFKESPEDEELNGTLKDLVVDVLVKSKKYRVIRDAQMAPKDKNYYEVYVLADYTINPNERYGNNNCEGNYCYAKAEVTLKSTGEVVGSSKKQEQMQCGSAYERTTSSFAYIRFIEEYQTDW